MVGASSSIAAKKSCIACFPGAIEPPGFCEDGLVIVDVDANVFTISHWKIWSTADRRHSQDETCLGGRLGTASVFEALGSPSATRLFARYSCRFFSKSGSDRYSCRAPARDTGA